MDVIKAQLERLKQQFAALNASQRMLVGTLVAVMALTIMYWSRYAGSPEMVPVLDSVLSTDQLGPIDNSLDIHGITHSDLGGKVLVQADRKTEAVAILMFDQVLPDNKESAFEEMNKQLNPFSGPSEHDENHVLALQMTLSEVIRHLDGVSSATVIINAKNEQRIEDSVLPSASVWVKSRGGLDKPKLLAKAIAKGVAGTVPSLRQENVVVNIDGRPYGVTPDGADGGVGSEDLLEVQQRCESQIEAKVASLYGNITNLHVVVTCDVENRITNQHQLTYEKPVSAPMSEHEHTEETTPGSASPAAEPGVGANSAASIATAASIGGANAGSSTVTDTENRNQVAFGSTDQTISTPAGKYKLMSAAVLVPRSYLLAAYKVDHSNKEPDDAALKAFTTLALADMKEAVKNSINLNSDAFSMGSYLDLLPTASATTAVAPPSVSLAVLTGHGKEIALGVLAVVSLFMMSSMVRKSAPAPAVAMAGGPMAGMGMGMGLGAGMGMPSAAGGSGFLGGGETVAGEAGSDASTLDGVEVDQDSVRTQNMLEQVSTMVKENPDNAAALVKRWMSRG